jgi:hypothetical protein
MAFISMTIHGIAFTRCSPFSFVRELADGVLSSAAVLRCGLGPLPPPLCRCAEYTADQLSRHSERSTVWLQTDPLRSPGAWHAQRSGIKEEAAGRGTAAELCMPSARASTVQVFGSQFSHARKQDRSQTQAPSTVNFGFINRKTP